MLRTEKADVNAADDHQGTPLHKAERKGNLAIVKLIVEKGAKPDAVDCNSKIAFNYCKTSVRSVAEISQVLQEANAKSQK